MQCPRCQSSRIQRDYDDTPVLIRLVGFHKLLCNKCGLVFKGFDPFGKLQRRPAAGDDENKRRGPRYKAHLPAAIALISERGEGGKVSYSEPSRGHCETIGEYGMSVFFIGTRFPEEELSRRGRLLYIRVDLPSGQIEGVFSLVTHERTGESGKKGWLLGVNLKQMAEPDKERLLAYLDSRAEEEPFVVSE